MVNGTFTNNGFIIIADTELNDRFSYRTSDASAATKRPKLVIEYTTSSATNTPTNTPTPGPSPTPTRTPTPGASPTPTATQPPQGAFNNATFVYDGDGKRVKSTFNGTTTTYFVGTHYEVTGSTITKYYYAGSQRIAMRTNGTLNYLLGDHLGSTSLTTNASGQVVSELRYKAWGETRYASGSTPTKYTYTGQYSYVSDFGLHFYNARWYDPSGHAACSNVLYGNGSISEDECAGYTDSLYGITFEGDWTDENKDVVRDAVRDIDLALSNEQCTYIAGVGTECSSSPTGQTFKSTFNTGVNFKWMSGACEINGYTCYGYAGNFPNTIQIYEKYWSEKIGQDGKLVPFQAATPVTAQLIVHELGHALNVLAGNRQPENYIASYDGGSLLVRPDGFASGSSFGQDNSASEIFADMFVGFVYRNWRNDDLGLVRAEVMTTNISTWITEAQNGR